jgi:hypothetical protein
MDSEPPVRASRYHAYLLRIWRETQDSPWHISLQEGANSERLGFAGLESLISYLGYVMQTEPKGEGEET